MTYGVPSSRPLICPNCSAELWVTEISQPDRESYELTCPWCGKTAESGKAGTPPTCTLIKAGDSSKKKSEV